MRAYSFGFRVTVWTVLALFLWSFGPLFQIPAFAVEMQKTPQMRNEGHRPEEKFEAAIESLRESVRRAAEKHAKGEDDSAEIEAIKTKKTELNSLAEEVRAELAATEKKLKDANLPKEILDRHYKFVKHYEDNLKELKTNLDDMMILRRRGPGRTGR